MILTLTINPAVDRNVTVDRLAFEDRGYILSRSESPGGRGINASRVIHSFGGKTLALADYRRSRGRAVQVAHGMLRISDGACANRKEIRTNLTITDKQGLTVKLNELGPPLSTKELDKVAAKVESKLDKATWFMICGSVPPGVPPHFYNHLIELAHKKKVKTLLDTDGDALAARARSAADRGHSESAGSRAPVESCAHHPDSPD